MRYFWATRFVISHFPFFIFHLLCTQKEHEMIAAQFDYQVANTLDEAVALLAKDPDGSKVLAGGHSLIPAMKLRLAQPQLLVDIARIKGLAYIREDGDRILIGATTTHYELESSELLKRICPLLPECAATIGDVQVRNKGTIGGSLAHSDPAGDCPAAAIALAGNQLDDQTIAGAAAHVCDNIDPNSDLYASGEYRCHLAQVHTRRAIQTALRRAK